MLLSKFVLRHARPVDQSQYYPRVKPQSGNNQSNYSNEIHAAILAFVLLSAILPSTAFAAIARDTHATGSGASLNFTPGISGNVTFVAAAQVGGTNTCSTATIGGTSMTQETHDPGKSGTIGPIYDWVVASTAVTTSQITLSVTCTSAAALFISDYSGVNGTTPVDVTNHGSNLSATSPFAATSTNTSVANDWLVAIVNSGAFTLSAGSNTTLLDGASPGNFDGGPFSTGANQLNMTWTGGAQAVSFAMVALEPASAVTSSTYDASNWWPFFTF